MQPNRQVQPVRPTMEMRLPTHSRFARVMSAVTPPTRPTPVAPRRQAWRAALTFGGAVAVLVIGTVVWFLA